MVLNIKAALANVDGDTNLLLELAALFCEESPKSLATLRDATACSDYSAIRAAAHGLKGSVATFGAQRAYDAAARLEGVAKSGDAAALPEAGAAFDAEIEELRSALQNLANDPRLERETAPGDGPGGPSGEPEAIRRAVPGKSRK